MLLHRPAWREYYKVGDGCAGLQARAGEHRENAGITVIEANRIDDHKPRQIVFIGHVIAVPGNYVEYAVLLLGHK